MPTEWTLESDPIQKDYFYKRTDSTGRYQGIISIKQCYYSVVSIREDNSVSPQGLICSGTMEFDPANEEELGRVKAHVDHILIDPQAYLQEPEFEKKMVW